MESFMDSMGVYAPLVMNAVKALVVLIIGWMVAGMVSGLVRRKVNANEKIDNTQK